VTAGAFTFYKRHMKHGTAEAKANHYFDCGALGSRGNSHTAGGVGGLKFGEASVSNFFFEQVAHGMYDWAMKGGVKPAF